MSTTTGEPSRARAALVLPTVFAELLDDRRILFIGGAAPEDYERLASRCRSLRVLDTVEGGRRRARGYRSSPYRPGPLGFQPGAFDAVVVPEVADLGDDAQARLVDLARIVDGGPVLVGTAPEGGVGYDALYGWISETFENIRIFGEEPFVGVAVGDFEAGDDPEVVVDSSLVTGERIPHWFFAVASDSSLRLPSYAIVRIPEFGVQPPTAPDEIEPPRRAEAAEAARRREKALESDLARLEASLAERSAELEDLRSEARELKKRLAAAERAAALATERPDPAITREHAELEERLVERAKKIRELEAEVERRGALVRDAVEEAREVREATRREDPRAIERAVTAEVARAEAQFQVDELRARVRELEETVDGLERGEPAAPPVAEPVAETSATPVGAPGADQAMVSRLEGRVAGVRFRLQNAERALAARSVAARRGELALDTVDQLRTEIAAQKAENGALTIEVVDLRAETRELRARAGDATSALAARDALVTRLQLELSQVEQQLRNAELRASRLAEETSSLRAAVVEAATAGEAGERATQEAEVLRAQVGELRDRARRLEADRFELEERAERADAARTKLEERLLAEERARAELEQKAKHLESERAALADEVLGLATELAQIDEQRRASAAAAPAEKPEDRERLESELELLRAHAEALEKERDAARALLSETRETLEGLRAPTTEPAPPPSGDGALERELHDRDVLLRSLTAQLEERNDRIRALERRLGGSIPAGAPDEELLKRQLLELQERASRLGEEVSAEREARRQAELRLEGLERRPDISVELGKLRDELGRSRHDLDLERGRAEGFERDVRSLREVCVEARQGLEALLGSATTSGDQYAADRIGQLLTVLGRY